MTKQNLIKILAFSVLCLYGALGLCQPNVLINGQAGTTGAVITNTTVNSSTFGCGAGVTANSFTTTSQYVYGASPSVPAFQGPTNICGTDYTGLPNKAFVLATASSPIQNFVVHFTSTAKASMGEFRCYDFDWALVTQANKSYSGTLLGGANILYSQNSNGLGLESNSAFTSGSYNTYHGGNCSVDATGHPVDPTAWVWITMQANAGSTHKMSIYKVNTDLSLSLVTTTNGTGVITGTNQSGNATFIEIGKSGGESEVAGNHTYEGNIVMDLVNGVFPLLPNTTSLQLWSGIIASARATDWTKAGVIGGIPTSYIQSGATIQPFGTAGTPAAATPINTALTAACDGTGKYVLLATGDYYLSTGIQFSGNNAGKCALKMAATTHLHFALGASVTSCSGGAGICFKSTDTTYPPISSYYTWSGGLAQGSTTLTLTAGTCSLGGTGACLIQAGSILVVNQQEDATSNTNLFDCSILWASATTGCSYNGPDSGLGEDGRFLQEMIPVVAYNSGTGLVTLARPIRFPNYRSGQNPRAWVYQPLNYIGVEGGWLDFTGDTTPLSAINCTRCANFWTKGVKISPVPTYGVWAILSSHDQHEQDYCAFALVVPTSGPHCINHTMASDFLEVNNISQGILTPFHEEGPSNGGVVAYNYCVNDLLTNSAVGEAARTHSNGNTFMLYEGNICPNLYLDTNHGTPPLNTAFRNFFQGWESCANGQCGSATAKDFHANPIILGFGSRYDNLIGNVLGTPGFHTTYQFNGRQNFTIFNLGEGGGPTPDDPNVNPTTMRWGNCDIVSNPLCRFVAAEVPSGIGTLPNPVPASQTLPASFIYTSKPTWFLNLPFPASGPDVTNGGLGICSGVLNTPGHYSGLASPTSGNCGPTPITTPAWGGHANMNPAMRCFVSVMGGPLDGVGSALPYDPATCYVTLPLCSKLETPFKGLPNEETLAHNSTTALRLAGLRAGDGDQRCADRRTALPEVREPQRETRQAWIGGMYR